MLRMNGKNINLSRYHAVTTKAIEDTAVAFNAQLVTANNTETTYLKYVSKIHDVVAPLWHRAGLTRSLVREVCKNFGFSVKFLKLASPELLPEGFVSWLLVNFKKCRLTIIYDPSSLSDLPGCSDVVYDRILAKVFLHECGHASLHLDEFRSRMGAGNSQPSLDPEHEQDAWLYALTVWSVFVGDYSFDTRTNGNKDQGWKLC